MMHAALIIFTVTTITWSLWVRRLTWQCKMEVAATLNLVLQGGAVILMSPWASEVIGLRLYGLTGQYNLEDLLGHDLYVIAASSVVYHLILRLDQRQMIIRFKTHVEMPATICLPLMYATFTAGAGTEIYRRDFFRVPCDFWLTAYWFIMCGTIVYLLAYSVLALVPMLHAHARLARLYLAASGAGIGACISRLITSVLPDRLQDTFTASIIVWFLSCLCGAGFALISGHSWLERQRQLTGAAP
ncbi:hypothetical protein BKG82_22935 [Mycobacteroides chelonae]|uniref:Bacteriophage protein n=2 Tax=Mycobacteroides chelonae TaxID=1774 RepID=A0A1S1LFA3_MYCCH|nr:hypothetical protein BKG82_22935 [Mycobacteroides chelonae]